MKKVTFQTLGCKLNYAETSTISRQFVEHGFQIVDANEPTDVFVLNTCSVTERADRECRQIIRRTHRHSPDAFVIVIGCYAQLQPEEIAGIEGVDLVIGSQEKFNIFKYTNGFQKKSVPQVFVSCIDEADEFFPAFAAETGERTRAFLKIQDGCDYSCSFCTIPLARGGSRSVPIDNILNQAQIIATQGFKEIVLTGVNVGDFDRTFGSNLFKLLLALEKINSIERIRISSIEPNLLTKEMIDFILTSEKFCNHFHIPLQSGSDPILKKMKRRYLSTDYRQLIEYIKNKDADSAIGVDVIVGFPSETKELFNHTHKFLVDLPISYLHVFTYSERHNTPAINFSERIEPRIRQERSESLRTLSVKKRRAFYSSFLGKNLPVLFEGNIHDGKLYGLTTNYIRVETAGDESIINTIQGVNILQIQDDHCIGERIDPFVEMISVNKLEESMTNN